MRRTSGITISAAVALALGVLVTQSSFGQQAQPEAKTNAAKQNQPDAAPDAADRTERREPTDRNQRPDATDRTQRPDANGQTQRDDAQPILLGVQIAPSRTTGVHIRDVRPGTPAGNAGLRPGDYILSFKETKLTSPEDFDEAMSNVKMGDMAQLVIWRNGQKQTLDVSFDEEAVARLRSSDNGQADDAPSDAWLGVLLSEAEEGQKGVRVERVYPGGPAARAGFFTGDIVTRVGDTDVNQPDQAAEIIGNGKPNETLEIVVMRGEEEVTLNPTLADRSRFFVQEQPEQGNGQERNFRFEDDEVSEHAMMLEQHRRFAEQHERMENLLYDLLDEVQALRKEVNGMKGNAANDRNPNPNPNANSNRNPNIND